MTYPHCAATTTTELTKRTQLGYRTFRVQRVGAGSTSALARPSTTPPFVAHDAFQYPTAYPSVRPSLPAM